MLCINKSSLKLRTEKLKAFKYPTGHTLSKVKYFLNISTLSHVFYFKIHFPSIFLCSS
jgi:hypothetical protein